MNEGGKHNRRQVKVPHMASEQTCATTRNIEAKESGQVILHDRCYETFNG